MKRFEDLLTHSKFLKKKYQYDGVEWCVRNELAVDPIHNVRGGIIADEMGLGKTIMMIGTMYANLCKRTLIVVPPILIEQWAKEIYRTSGHRALVYYGSAKKSMTLEQILLAPIVLTSYHAIAIRKNNPEMGILHKIMWNRVIFDEAHHLRNKQTSLFWGCKNIRAPCKWFVTGTPIQNKKTDFYSLCNALGLPVDFYTDSVNKKLIREKFILYRTKEMVDIQLPPVHVETCVVLWKNNDEKKLAEEIHSTLNISGVSYEKGGSFSNQLLQNRIIVAFLRAKQSCIMTSLMKNNIDELIQEERIEGNYQQSIVSTSKLDAVIGKIVSRRGEGKGKIVFCQFLQEMDYLLGRLTERGLVVMRYRGDKKIGGINDKKMGFMNGIDVLILQIQTGCEGLNLQENFNEVYFVSPHWNPAIEDQAIARCHRIGQQHDVHVFKFVMEDFDREDDLSQAITLETYIQNVQDYKRLISHSLLVEE